MSTKKSPPIKEYRLDATHKSPGRLASEVAVLVRGKRIPTFLPHALPPVRVIISNINKMSINEKKLDRAVHRWFTKYPGGLKVRTWRVSFSHNPELFFLRTVRRMLPPNKLRNQLLKKITFE